MTIDLDGGAIAEALALVGASDPGVDTELLRGIEEAVGAALPEETRALVRAAPRLHHPDAEHPEIPDPGDFAAFALGLPDPDAFLATLSGGLLGPYACALHFDALFPVGVQLQYGDFMYALARLESYAPGVGGVLYYDERELGTWGATCSAFLHRVRAKFAEEASGELDGLDEDERAEFELDPDGLRDCFPLHGVEPTEPPEGEVSAALGARWEPVWRRHTNDFGARTWLPWFFAKRFPTHLVQRLPTRATWEAERDAVGATYGDTMYWLVAHALLGNEEELQDTIERSRPRGGTFVTAIRAAAPGWVGRFAGHREALYEAVRSA